MTDDEPRRTAIRLADDLDRAEQAFEALPKGMPRPVQGETKVVRWSNAKRSAFAKIDECRQRLDEYSEKHPECFDTEIPN